MTESGVLLVGGGGFIGAALARDLCARRHQVHVVTRESLPPFQHHGLTVHVCGRFDSGLIKELLGRCHVVFYLASCSTPGTSARRPVAESEENLAPSLRFLDVLQSRPGVRLIYFSSGGTVYGGNLLPEGGKCNPAQVASESLAPRPISYHGAGKVAFEAFLSAYAQQFSATVTVVRPSNVYGPGQPFKPSFGVIRMMLERAATREPLEIWGDGETTRDFLYIDDLVHACDLVMQDRQAPGVMTYNVGSGQTVSLNSLCDIVTQVTGRPLLKIHRDPRRVDVRDSALDCTRMRSRLGWRPAVGLTEGVRRTWQWLKASART